MDTYAAVRESMSGFMPGPIRSSILCAETSGGNCPESSGDPGVVFNRETGIFSLIGIVSGQLKLKDCNYPTMLTDLGDADIFDFVMSTMGKQGKVQF